MQPKLTRIEDIAIRAGVSKAAVSMALRNHPGVSKSLCGRIQALADEMGYRRNPLLAVHMAAIRTGRTTGKGRRLGYIHAMPGPPPPANPSPLLQGLFKGACERAHEMGYGIEVFSLHEAGMTSQRLSRILRARGIDGVVVGPVPEEEPALELDWNCFATATMGYSVVHPLLHRACSDHFEMLRSAMGFLVARGYRRIGLLVDRNLNHRVGDRLLGSYLSYSPPARDIRLLKPFLTGYEWKAECYADWFRKQRPDAVMVNDQTMKMRVDAMHLQPSVTTLDFHQWHTSGESICQRVLPEDVAAACVDLVIEQLLLNRRGLPAKRKTVLIQPT